MKSSVKKNIPFGLHLMLDMYNCCPEALNNKNLVEDTLKALPKILKMKPLIDPVVTFAQPNGKRDPGGWSGFIMIHESHISIHTFIKRGFVTVDVYSCKKFNAEKAIGYFKNIFKTEDLEQVIEVRGRKYPEKNLTD